MNSVSNLTEQLTNTNKYYTDGNYGFPYTEANCTDYAYDSALYLLDQGKIKLFNRSGWFGNACNWYNEYKYEKGSEPKVGAIMCWKVSDGGNAKGHVAICTNVNSDGTVDGTAGAYGGKKFYTFSHYNYKRSNFQGFLYLPNYNDDPTPTPTPTPSKSIDEVAREVIAGKWGNGEDRKNRLTAAGYNYSEVQARVNEILHSQQEETYVPAIGDDVIINGPLYLSSDATIARGTVSNKRTKITRYAKGGKHPYNTTGDLGWMDASSIKKA